MSTPTISYRQLDANWDPRWGQGRSDFLTNLEAVAQAIWTRLRLFEGEWWANQGDGLPLWQSILGVGGARRNLQANTILIVDRILGTPFVIGVTDVQSSFNSTTRAIKFFCRAQTPFGTLVITSTPATQTPPQPPVIPSSIVQQDSSGGFWSITISSDGLLQASPLINGTPRTVYLNDLSTAATTWLFGINTFGQLMLTPATYDPTAPTSVSILAQITQATTLIQVSNGLLQTAPG